MPLDITERLVRHSTNGGETVFSPFMGIGSEGFVSLKCGRRFVGTELKESYFRQAVRNLQEVERDTQAALFDHAAGIEAAAE
jgi:DNA modification methylase